MKTVEMSNSIFVIEYWMRIDKMLRYCSFSSKLFFFQLKQKFLIRDVIK